MTAVHRRAFFATGIALVIVPSEAAAKARRKRTGVGWLYGVLVTGSLLGLAWNGSRHEDRSDTDERNG